MHMWCSDVTYDVMALIKDETSKRKMMSFGHSMSKVRYQKIAAIKPQDGPPRSLGGPCDTTYMSCNDTAASPLVNR